MAIAEIPHLLSDVEKRRRDREIFIKTRLMHVYRFAQELLGKNHLDIGTYDGFALSTLAQAAEYVTSFDISNEILEIAQSRPDVQQLLLNKQLSLYQMDARNLAFPNNVYDSATLVEVLGGAFEGTRDDICQMFSEAGRVLKPGAPLIFTIKSQSNEQILKQYFDWDILKGYPQYRPQMEELLIENGFGFVDWYGHVFMKLTNQGNPILPLTVSKSEGNQKVELDERYFLPKPAEQFEKANQTLFPLYWIGVARTFY